MGNRAASIVLPMPRGGGPELNDYAQEVKVILETAFAEIGGAATPLTAATGLLAANNLSDVASVATARTNLAVLGIANNLSDVASAATARTNLGLPHAVAQVVTFETGAVATGVTVVPADDTIPQNTEGDQYMTLAITPTNASSTLIIEVIWIGASSVGAEIGVALFQDAAANALAAVMQGQVTVNVVNTIPLRHKMTAGTTSATTFKVRAGTNTAGTTTFNGSSGGRLFGGVMSSSIVVTEILP